MENKEESDKVEPGLGTTNSVNEFCLEIWLIPESWMYQADSKKPT